ncbi:MAG: two-component sensor histidine kinase [Desulfobacula sp. RIFOXYB2_FULL_45_6]|nr:MAG: two-component sensor histidine kinase [Desulfobacula sp. RIFOXYB2_FULL_45_6]
MKSRVFKKGKKVENLSAERNVFYEELSRKIKILILVVSFFPMTLTAGILFYRFNLTYTDKIQAHISELVQRHTQNIDTFLSEKLGNIGYLANQLEHSPQSPKEFLKKNMELLEIEYNDAFTDLGLVNENGLQVAYEGPFKLENADYKEAEWFLHALEKPFYISDVFAGLRGHPHFIIAVKVNLHGIVYILRATINFMRFNSMVENIHIGKTGIAYILNGKGQLQTKADIKINPAIIASHMDEKNTGKNGTIITEQQDAAGNTYLYVISTLKNIDWSVVFRQDKRDAFSDLWKTQFLTVIVFIGGCIAIIFVAFTLPRYIVTLISSAETKSEAMNRQVVESGKLASIGELAAGIAHEINNPVAIMVEEAGWMEDLLEDEALRESENLGEFKRALKQINTQGKRCKEITHKLLSFARKTDSTINDVEVNEAVREMVSLTTNMARYNNVTMETKLEEGLPFIRISPAELQQVMLNLINNAIDAMEKTGGVIKIETKKSKIEKNHIAISIEDNGPGIPKDNLERIFDPFFTTKAVGKGTGLGLSICYGLVRKMGGKIDVASQVGIGTKFRIWIPFQDDLNQTQDKEFHPTII